MRGRGPGGRTHRARGNDVYRLACVNSIGEPAHVLDAETLSYPRASSPARRPIGVVSLAEAARHLPLPDRRNAGGARDLDMGRLLPRSLWDARNPPAIPHHDERQSREYPHPSASARPSRLGDWPRSGTDGGISTLSQCHAGPTPAKMRFSCDSPLEDAVRSELVSGGQIPC